MRVLWLFCSLFFACATKSNKTSTQQVVPQTERKSDQGPTETKGITKVEVLGVIDLQAERELYRIRVGQKPKQIALGNKLNNGQKYLYVVNSLSGDVSVIQTENRLEVNRINTGRRSAVVAIQPLSLGREILYIIDRGGIVSAVEMPRQTMVKDIGLNLPQGPSSGNYNPKTNQIYVLHRTSQQLSVLYAD